MTVFGRVKELQEAREALTEESARIIMIAGPRGIGKTTLASELVAHFRDRSSFFEKAPITIFGHGKNEELLADEIYRGITEGASRSQRPESLPDLITEALEQSDLRGLVFIDNVEDEVLETQLFQQIVSLWLNAQTRIVLMMTARNWNVPIEWCNIPQLRILRLAGLQEPAAILEILGPSLGYRFTDRELLAASAILENAPQNLLYMRWAEPVSLTDFLQAYRAGSADTSIDALRRILNTISGSELYAALGLLRIIDYSHEIIEDLWRRLSSNSPTPTELWEQLIQNQLLLPIPGIAARYRIHPRVHLDLLRLCEERGNRWIRLVHECALEMFGKFLTANRDDLQACTELVHHAIALDQQRAAIRAIFGSGGIHRWRTLGLSVYLEQALAEMRDSIAEFPQIWPAVDIASVHLASAEVASDLGRPKICLNYLTEAERTLEGQEPTAEIADARRAVWFQMAVSHANVGMVTECIDYYARIIRTDPEVIYAETALCMGYLGYEYCDILDFEHATQWSELALSSCSRERDPAIFSKNLCNRALVLFQRGLVDEARTHLEDALELVGAPGSPAADVREHGRVMLTLGTVYIAQPDVALGTVEKRLQEAVLLARKAGDARRVATATGRLGIVYALRDDFGQGVRALSDAVTTHRDLGDLRNMTLEIYNLLAIRALRTGDLDLLSSTQLLGSIDRLLPGADFRHPRLEVDQALHIVEGTSLGERYRRFWDKCLSPTLFRRVRRPSNDP